MSPPSVYYNDSEPFVCAWLKNLITAGLLPAGDVDERPIQEVMPDDVRRYTQAHFFAGIGGWPYALQLADWGDRPVWTGSCPCQPLSVAGLQRAHADQRHLWPAFYRLIAKCQPPVVFGEQVASKLGREWFAGVRADMEGVGYACGAADLCAASVGAPHPRQRLYWLADAKGAGGWSDARTIQIRTTAGLHEAQGKNKRGAVIETGRPGDSCTTTPRVGNTTDERLQGQWREYSPRGQRHSGLIGLAMQADLPEWNGPTVAVQCSDGARRVSAEPDSFPLAHGVPTRMGRLRGYGNAIVPQVAAAFVSAYMECAP